MFGELQIYNTETRLSLFESNSNFNNIFIFIGGLTDGLLALPYLPLLSTFLEKYEYSLVQPLLTSSYLGYGNVNLEKDIEEIDKVIDYIVDKKNNQISNKKNVNLNKKELYINNNRKIILMGHSTGAQDAVYYMKHGKNKNLISGIILQGAVSDREYSVLSKGITKLNEEINLAKELLNSGKGNYYMPPDTDDAPITAERFLSLNNIGGTDDMFSTDFTDEQLGQTFLKLDILNGKYETYLDRPILLISSGKDEYVSSNVNMIEHTKRMQKLASIEYWKENENTKKVIKEDYEISENVFLDSQSIIKIASIIPEADHAISGKVQQEKLLEVIELFLKKFIEN